MKKRIGKIVINPQETDYNKNIYKDIPIWGSIWWDEEREIFMSGIYMNFSPRQFKALFDIVDKIMKRGYPFNIKLRMDRFGERYQVGLFCKQGSIDLDIIIKMINNLKVTNDDLILYSAKVEMSDVKFKDIIKASVVKSL